MWNTYIYLFKEDDDIGYFQWIIRQFIGGFS